MIGFRNNKILFGSENLGERFRVARIGANIKIEDAAEELSINPRYLRALESGQLRKLPAGIYRKNIIMFYARFLGLEEEEITELFEQEDVKDHEERRRNIFSRKIPHVSYFLPTSKIIRSAILIIVVLACIGYLGVCFKRIVAPPKLIVLAPESDIVTDRSNIEIRGITEPEAEVIINGESVLTDTTGSFTKTINLKSGMNIILVSAQKKYSQKNSITKQVLVKGGG
jgi:transcriptional regulator with XRE-family HTH domain